MGALCNLVGINEAFPLIPKKVSTSAASFARHYFHVCSLKTNLSFGLLENDQLFGYCSTMKISFVHIRGSHVTINRELVLP